MEAHTSASSGTFADDRAANSTYWTTYRGIAINWEAETPWSDLDNRNRLKMVHHVRVDAKGSSAFTLEIYSDKVIYNPLTLARDPQVSIELNGQDAGGFGQNSPYFGGGRDTGEPMRWSAPARGFLMKLRFSGASVDPLKITATTLYYLLGRAQG
jgi:hypothetical protein